MSDDTSAESGGSDGDALSGSGSGSAPSEAGAPPRPPPPPAAPQEASTPDVNVAPGWYPVNGQWNVQTYWDGERWAKTRHWQGTAWIEDYSYPAAAAAAAPGAAAGAAPADAGAAGGVVAPPGGATPAGFAYGASPAPPQYSQGPYSAPPYMGPPQPMMGRPMMAQTTNGSAIASLVLSILGLFGIGSLLGIIFGFKARREIRASRGYQTGDGLALAGIIIGFVTLGLFLIVITLWIIAITTIHEVNSTITTDQQQQNTQSQTIQNCDADAKVVEVALTAYQAQRHSFPTPPAPWSQSTYVSNFGPLTTSANGGPFLHNPPTTSNYTIEYDSAGHIWVAPPNTFEGTYDSTQDFTLNPDACLVAVTP